MDIDVIIVSTNEKRLLKTAIKSLFAFIGDIKIRIIVIDNNSKDGTSLYVERNYPLITIIKNDKIEGFAHNCNLGIKHSNSKYVLLLNPDTEVLPGSIGKLYNFLETNPKVGICGPQLIFPDGKLQMSCRRFPTWKTAFIRRSPFRGFFVNSKENRHHLGYDFNHSKSQPIDWLLGACLLIRRKMIKDIGLLDEKYFLYVDDIDYCYSAWKKKWPVWYVPTSIVVHHHAAASDKKLINIPSCHHLRSMWHYYRKNMTKNYLELI